MINWRSKSPIDIRIPILFGFMHINLIFSMIYYNFYFRSLTLCEKKKIYNLQILFYESYLWKIGTFGRNQLLQWRLWPSSWYVSWNLVQMHYHIIETTGWGLKSETKFTSCSTAANRFCPAEISIFFVPSFQWLIKWL